jgi:cyclophilin family peptidyl-prolyl cis-trans isomerase
MMRIPDFSKRGLPKMIRLFSTALLLSALVLFTSPCQVLLAQQNAPIVAPKYPQAIIHTSMGDIGVELYEEKSPVSVANFIRYANDGFYEGTIFHRVISHFMIQGGGMTEDMQEKPTLEPIINEAPNGLSNKRGTLAMARTSNPHSATSQFFINVQDNKNLDYTSQGSSAGWGYAVFGKVISGLDVVDEIRFVETKTVPPHGDVPVAPVFIQSVEIITEPPAE